MNDDSWTRAALFAHLSAEELALVAPCFETVTRPANPPAHPENLSMIAKRRIEAEILDTFRENRRTHPEIQHPANERQHPTGHGEKTTHTDAPVLM